MQKTGMDVKIDKGIIGESCQSGLVESLSLVLIGKGGFKKG